MINKWCTVLFAVPAVLLATMYESLNTYKLDLEIVVNSIVFELWYVG